MFAECLGNRGVSFGSGDDMVSLGMLTGEERIVMIVKPRAEKKKGNRGRGRSKKVKPSIKHL